MEKQEKGLIEECYQKSIELLLNNSSDFGILAAAPQFKADKRNYLSVFARDAAICSLGMVASGHKKLIKTAKKGLVTLAKHQSEEGEIPNYVKPKNNYVDFWKMECIDATLWWLIAIKFFDKYAGDKNKLGIKFKAKIQKAVFWLECQMHAQDKLLVQNEASDWADIMPRTGKVLYSNALWYKVNDLYGLKNKNAVKRNFNKLFFPFNNQGEVLKCEKRTVEKILKTIKPKNFYLSFVNYLFWGNETDVFGNSLALIFGLPEKVLKDDMVKYFLSQKRKIDLPMPVLFNPIKENSKLWREYMKSYKQNYPYQYHNGGIWPFAACFWAISLVGAGKKSAAWLELGRIAAANKAGNWRFSEWFHARTGAACGMRGQSWNAGAFLLAYNYLWGKIKL